MTKRAKMCPRYNMGCDGHWIGNQGLGNSVYCYGKNKDCEIITPKKSKTVKVKAWAYYGEDQHETPGLHVVPEQYDGAFPVTILIQAKYLKGAK